VKSVCGYVSEVGALAGDSVLLLHGKEFVGAVLCVHLPAQVGGYGSDLQSTDSLGGQIFILISAFSFPVSSPPVPLLKNHACSKGETVRTCGGIVDMDARGMMIRKRQQVSVTSSSLPAAVGRGGVIVILWELAARPDALLPHDMRQAVG
jgi:hypothetical protein